MDYFVKLPAHFRSVSAFEDGHSRNRPLAAALADVVQFAQPGASANPQALVSDIYSMYCGADTPANQSSLTVQQALDYLSRQGILALDMSSYVANLSSGDAGQIALKHEIQAMNMNNVPQLLILGSDEKLLNALNGQPLHNWSTPGQSSPAALIRAGFSTDVANAFYLDPALGPQFAQPVPIAWTDITNAGILGCVAVLPPGVELPPAGFTFAAGVNPDGSTAANQWPVPVPTVNTDIAAQRLQEMIAAYDQLASIVTSTSSTLRGNAQQVLQQLGKG